jgi:signal transduction histidine kinase
MSPLQSVENEPAAAPAQTEAPKADPGRHLGRLVAHELNNILTVIQGHADLLLLKHGENPEVAPELRLISAAARRAATVIHNASRPNADKLAGKNSPLL